MHNSTSVRIYITWKIWQIKSIDCPIPTSSVTEYINHTLEQALASAYGICGHIERSYAYVKLVNGEPSGLVHYVTLSRIEQEYEEFRIKTEHFSSTFRVEKR